MARYRDDDLPSMQAVGSWVMFLVLLSGAATLAWYGIDTYFLEPAKEKNIQVDAIRKDSERKAMLQTIAAIESMQPQIDAAQAAYESYVTSLPKDTSQWSNPQKLENNRLVTNLNGLLAEQARLIADFKGRAAASPQAVTSEIQASINKLNSRTK